MPDVWSQYRSVRHGAAGWPPNAAMLVIALAIVVAACGNVAGPAAPGSWPAQNPTSIAASSAGPTSPAPSGPPSSAAPSAAPISASAPPGTSTSPTLATPVPTPGSAFTLLRVATGADPTLPAPDARTFVSSFPPKAPALYVVFALQRGLTGTVVCTVTANGAQAAGPITLMYGAKNSWGDFRVTSRGTFVVGSYRATLVFVPTGGAATVDFAVQ